MDIQWTLFCLAILHAELHENYDKTAKFLFSLNMPDVISELNISQPGVLVLGIFPGICTWCSWQEARCTDIFINPSGSW